jgi:hypothetical protein
MRFVIKPIKPKFCNAKTLCVGKPIREIFLVASVFSKLKVTKLKSSAFGSKQRTILKACDISESTEYTIFRVNVNFEDGNSNVCRNVEKHSARRILKSPSQTICYSI